MRVLQLALRGVAFTVMAAVASLVSAQNYPVKPVRIVVPFGAGGPADLYARFLAQQLQQPMGQNIIVENRPGAGSIIGTDVVAKSLADGYTLLLMSNTHTVNESLIPKKPFTLMKDFAPVAPINYSDLILVVHPSLPVRSVSELVKLAKAKDKGLNYASSGNGTPYHMAGELFQLATATRMTHIPFKGMAPAIADLVGGSVEASWLTTITSVPLVEAGRLRFTTDLASAMADVDAVFIAVGTPSRRGAALDVKCQ